MTKCEICQVWFDGEPSRATGNRLTSQLIDADLPWGNWQDYCWYVTKVEKGYSYRIERPTGGFDVYTGDFDSWWSNEMAASDAAVRHIHRLMSSEKELKQLGSAV